MSTTPKAWMVTIHYGDGETGAASDVYAGTPEAAEQIAEERSRGFGFISRPIPLYGEHSQPLADELARVKAERDELRSIANHCLGILSVTEPHSEMVARLKEYFDKYLLP